MTPRRAALVILRRYPAAWRERYESEVAGLIDDSQLRWHDVAELTRGMLTERARELVEADDRPKRTARILFSLRCLFGVAFIGAALGLGSGMRTITGSVPDDFADGAAVVWGAALIVFIVVLLRTRKGALFGAEYAYSASAVFTLLPALFGLLVAAAWLGFLPPDPPYDSKFLPGWLDYLPPMSNTMYLGIVAVDLAGGLLPGGRMLSDLFRLAAAEAEVRSAQQFVDGCRDMISKGVPSPLADAEAALQRTKRAEAEARDRLYALGYRARFRNDVGGGPVAQPEGRR